MHHLNAHFIVGQLRQGVNNSFGRTLNVCLHNQGEGLYFAIGRIRENVFQFGGLLLGQLHITVLALTEKSDFTGFTFIGQNHDFVAGLRHTRQTLNLHRNGRTGFTDGLTGFINHGTDTTEFSAGQNNVTAVKGTGLHKNGCHRTATLIQTGFDHKPLGHAFLRCFQIKHFGLKQHVFQQFIYALTGFGRHRNKRYVTAPVLRHHIVLNKFLFNAFRIGFRLIDLVDRHHHRNTSGLGVSNSFLRLGHHTVIGSHHQNHNIGGLSTARTHSRKSFVPRRIQEGHNASRSLNVVSTDMLRDTAGFTSRYLGTTNVVKQARLTVVDVTHDGHHRRTRKSLSRIFFHHVAQNRFRIIGLGSDRMMSHFFNHDHRGVLIEHLVNRHHLPHLHERLNHFGGFNGHLMSKISHADRFRHAHITHHGFCVLNLLLLGLFMTAVIAVFTRTTPLFIAVIILIDNTGIALVAATMFNVIVPFARYTMVGTGVLAALFLAA